MDCDKTRKLLQAYFDNELEIKEADEIKKHLEECKECSKYAGEISKIKKISGYIPKIKTSSSYMKTLREKIKMAEQQRAFKSASIRIFIIVLFVLVSLLAVYGIYTLRPKEIAKAFWSRYGNEQVKIKNSLRSDWKKVPINSSFYPGFAVSTEKNRYFAIECSDGSVIALTQESEISFNRKVKDERINIAVERGGVYLNISAKDKNFIVNIGESKVVSKKCEFYSIVNENIFIITMLSGEAVMIYKDQIMLLHEDVQVFIKKGLQPEIFKGSEVNLALNEARLHKPLAEGQFNSFIYNTKISVKDALVKISREIGINLIIEKEIKFNDDREITYSAYAISFGDFLSEILKKNQLNYLITGKGIKIISGKKKIIPDKYKLFPVDKAIPFEYRELIKEYYRQINRHKQN